MRDRFLAAWRAACHAFWPLLIVFLADRGIHVSEHWSSVGELALIGAGAGLWAFGVHWLQTRPGPAWWARTARTIGRVLVLGSIAIPTYTTTPPPPPGAP